MPGTEASSRSGAQALDARTRKKFLEVYPAPDTDVARPVEAPRVLISHAGEQKSNLVAHILERLLERRLSSEDVFVDEYTMKCGELAMARISAACHGAKVAVVILSKHYVRKPYCMGELRILLQRNRAGGGGGDDGSQQPRDQSAADKVQLLPVLYDDMTVDKLTDMRTHYETEPWCVKVERPPDEVLELWAADLKAVTDLVLIRPDQYKDDVELKTMVTDLVMKHLGPVQRVIRDSTPPPQVALVGRDEATGRPTRYHVFLSHAGQQKYEIVGWMHRRFKERLPGVNVFLDEVSLQPGARAPAEMIEACSTASVGIAIISSDFVTKAWPMLELCRMVGRLATEPNSFMLLPVLYLSPNGSPAQSAADRRQRVIQGLKNSTLELTDFDDFEELIQVYKGDKDARKRDWGEALGKLTGVTMIRKDPKTFDADIVERILVAAEAHLRTSGAMPRNVVVGGGGWFRPPLEVKLVGREEVLKQGLDALLKHRYVEIRGPPGEGKSTLAQQLVQDLVSKWSRQLGGQSIYALQVDMREVLGASVKPKRAVAAALLRLAGQAVADADWPALLVWITRPARVVVVFENAEVGLTKEHGDAFLEMLGDLHRQAGVSLVVPTRVEGSPAEVGILDVGACVVKLQPLTAEQGLEQVQAHLGPGYVWGGAAEKKAARQLVSLVDGNPLVLSVAAGLVRNSMRSRVRCSWQGILENARAKGLDAVAPVGGAGGMRNRMTLLRGWLCDFLEPDQQAFLGALTVFAGSFTAAGAAAVTDCAEAQKQLDRLSVALLVREGAGGQQQPEGQGPRYSMHALVKDAARGLSDAAGAQRGPPPLQAFFDWMLLSNEGPGQQLLESMPDGLHPNVPLRLYLLGVELLNFAALGAELAGAVGQNPGRLKKLLPGMLDVGHALSRNGAGDAARQIHESVVDASRNLLGLEHPDTLTSKNNLATTLWYMGEWAAARRLQEEVLDVRARLLGPEHPDTLASKHNLALTLRAMGERAAARRLQEEVLDVRTRVLGPEHPNTLTSKNNLANSLRDMGERAVARRLQVEVLDVRTRVLGPEHPDTVTSKSNLAATLRDMGERAEARPRRSIWSCTWGCWGRSAWVLLVCGALVGGVVFSRRRHTFLPPP